MVRFCISSWTLCGKVTVFATIWGRAVGRSISWLQIAFQQEHNGSSITPTGETTWQKHAKSTTSRVARKVFQIFASVIISKLVIFRKKVIEQFIKDNLIESMINNFYHLARKWKKNDFCNIWPGINFIAHSGTIGIFDKLFVIYDVFCKDYF